MEAIMLNHNKSSNGKTPVRETCVRSAQALLFFCLLKTRVIKSVYYEGKTNKTYKFKEEITMKTIEAIMNEAMVITDVDNVRKLSEELGSIEKAVADMYEKMSALSDELYDAQIAAGQIYEAANTKAQKELLNDKEVFKETVKFWKWCVGL